MATKIESEQVFAKIRHPLEPRVFIERQLVGPDHYQYICHTGIDKFVPELYETQAEAIEAVTTKLKKKD